MDIITLRKWIAERDSASILETYNIRTGERKTLREFGYVIEAPNWTQDGKFLVYNSAGRIFKFELTTGTVSEIDSGFAIDCNNDHVLSPDGKLIAVSHFTHADATSRIYIFPIAGGDPKLITPIGPSYLHGWSPDGKYLAYCAERGGQYDVFTISVDGGNENQLTHEPGLDDGPEYSPDGKYIWFNSVRSGLMQVWRMNADGSDQTQMLNERSNDWFPHLSPNGQHVVFISYAEGDVKPGDHPANKQVELKLMPASGGEVKTLVRLFGGQGSINVNSWAPDSETFAFVSYKLID